MPEADRDVHVTPIYNEKKCAIPAIPIVDEDGEEIVESEDDSKVAADHFKQSVYDNDLRDRESVHESDTASKFLYNTEPVNIKLTKKMLRRASSKKKKNVFG